MCNQQGHELERLIAEVFRELRAANVADSRASQEGRLHAAALAVRLYDKRVN